VQPESLHWAALQHCSGFHCPDQRHWSAMLDYFLICLCRYLTDRYAFLEVVCIVVKKPLYLFIHNGLVHGNFD
jgi:hypothetical protein